MADEETIKVSLTQVIAKIEEMQEDLGKISIILKSVIQEKGEIQVALEEDYICKHPQPGPWKSPT